MKKNSWTKKECHVSVSTCLLPSVNLLHRELSVPVTCKIRVFEDVGKTVRYAKMLEEAGCQVNRSVGGKEKRRGLIHQFLPT